MSYDEGLQVGKDPAQNHKSYAYFTTTSYAILDNTRSDRVFFMNLTQSKATPNEPGSQGTSSGGGLRCQDAMRDAAAQTSLKLTELIELYTNLQNMVLDLETTKTTHAMEINSLKSRVNKLENKQSSRTHKLKRLYNVGLSARVESSDDEGLGEEDASKQGRIADIDANEDIYLVNVHNDEDMFGVNNLDSDEVIVESEDVAEQAKEVVDDITLAKALMAIKSAKPKADKVLIQEPEQGTTTTTSTTITAASSRPKAKGIVIHDQEQEQRLESERAQQEKEANIALIGSWDDVQDKINVDYELAQRLQEKKDELADAEKAKLFMDFLKKRRKFFAAKRAEEKRNKPPIKAQQRNIMSTYLKNIDG
nr:hypothetical protein [Tanacetum cinerariifolium]